MYKIIYPTRDTTLYSRHPDRNTGADQILEITKVASGSAIEDIIGSHEYWDTNFNSRFLIDFDITDVSASIASGDISNARFYLTVKATEAINLPIEYTLYGYPVSGSWVNGTGHYNNDFEVSNGSSWRYRDSKGQGTRWSEAGGDYYSASAYEASVSFNYESPDMRMDVSNIVNAWISGSIPQNGIIVKHSDSSENDGSELGSIKFFSKDTHTIYIPRLEVFWDDVDVSGTGSVSQISGDDYIVYSNNLRESYYENEMPKIRIGVRDRFPTKTYTTSNANLTTSRLPFTSYFQVMDSVTDEVIIPFDTTGTRVSCDASGNYIKLDMNSFLAERFYKIIFKIETDSGNTVNYADNGLYFRVRRK
jgi:hypothetical protein